MYEFFIELQKCLSNLVEFKPLSKIEKIVAIDVAYKGDFGFSVAVVFDIDKNKLLEEKFVKGKVVFPYIPTLLFLREAPLVLQVLKKMESDYDLIVIDGHGLAHPRKAGIATIVGIITKKPTIGIAKKFLYGEVKDNVIYVDGQKIGLIFGKYFASIGSNIDFHSLKSFLEKLNFKYPEALKIADKLSKAFAKNSS